MPFLNINQILQERVPGFHRKRYKLNKIYSFLAIISFTLSILTFLVYFSTYEINFRPFKNQQNVDDIIQIQDSNQQIQSDIERIKNNRLGKPAIEFFDSEEFENLGNIGNIQNPIYMGTISLKQNKTYNFSINFPMFSQSDSLFYRNKSIHQFTRQQDQWKDLKKIKDRSIEEEGKTIYPAGLIAGTLPFDRILLIDQNNNVIEPVLVSKNKFDGKKVVVQNNVENLVLPTSWNIENTDFYNPTDETITSIDGNSILPKSFIKNSRLLNWMSIGSFKNYHLNIGNFENLDSGKYRVYLLDYNLNTIIQTEKPLKDRKYRLRQKRVIDINSLALPIFLILNGFFMIGLSIYA